MNTGVDVAPDSVLGRFGEKTKGLTPQDRCIALETDTTFKQEHAGFASQGQSAEITSDQSKVRHHFVAFVVKNDVLIELDGTKQGPHVIGECKDGVLRGSIKEIQRRLAEGEISDQLSMMTLQPNEA